MFLLVPGHPGCPGQNPKSHKTVVCVCVCVCVHGQKQRDTQKVTDEINHHTYAQRGHYIQQLQACTQSVLVLTATGEQCDCLLNCAI